MKTYLLKQSGETISKIKASDEEAATEMFAKTKRLTIDILLELFVIEEDTK